MRTTSTTILGLSLGLAALTAAGCDGDDEMMRAPDAAAEPDGAAPSEGDAGTDAQLDAGGTGGTGAAQGLSLETLCAQFESYAQAASCSGVPDLEVCEASNRRLVDGCAGLMRAVEQGRLTYDAVAATTCANESSTFGSSPEGLLNDCPEVFRGQVAAEEPCYDGYVFGVNDCQPDLYCDVTFSCPSTCLEYAEEGEPCEGVRCVDGLACAEIAGAFRCVMPGADGSECEVPEQCFSSSCEEGQCVTPSRECDAPEACGTGRTCVENVDGSSMCGDVAAEGDACPTWGCAREHYCRDEGGDTGVCRADGELGDACDAPVDLGEDPAMGRDENPSCVDGLSCMLSSTGTCLPPGGLDEPCDTRRGESCEEGLACVGSTDSTCQTPNAIGAACNPVFNFGAACADAYCACSDPSQTGDDVPCTEGECVALLELGEPCTRRDQCAMGFCEIFQSEPVCGIPLGLRDACVPPE